MLIIVPLSRGFAERSSYLLEKKVLLSFPIKIEIISL